MYILYFRQKSTKQNYFKSKEFQDDYNLANFLRELIQNIEFEELIFKIEKVKTGA